MVHSRHSLLVALVVTTAVVTAVLSWAGWRLLDQQRAIDRQRAQEQLGAAAEGMAAAIWGKLAETGELLSAATASPDTALPAIHGAAVLLARADGAVTAAAGLPFVPVVPDTSTTDALFIDAEALEFARADLPGASRRYETLATHRDPAVRAGALQRLARVAERRGDAAAARVRLHAFEPGVLRRRVRLFIRRHCATASRTSCDFERPVSVLSRRMRDSLGVETKG